MKTCGYYLREWGGNMRNLYSHLFAGLALTALLACGGGVNKPDPTPPSPRLASSLVYTDPGGTGYRFVRGADSTSNTLILELRGPASETGRGVTFGLQIDTSKAKFVKISPNDVEFVQNGVFELGDAPRLFKSVLDGNNDNTLRASIAQKSQGNAKPLNEVLARVAVQLQPGVAAGTISLSALDARVLPGDSGASIPITSIAVGNLAAQ